MMIDCSGLQRLLALLLFLLVLLPLLLLLLLLLPLLLPPPLLLLLLPRWTSRTRFFETLHTKHSPNSHQEENTCFQDLWHKAT